MYKYLTPIFFCLMFFSTSAQRVNTSLSKTNWVDSVFKSLSDDEKISQLIIVRLSTIDSKTGKVSFFDNEVTSAIQQYNIGGICLFQGGPVQQTSFINQFQSIAKTPIQFSIDAETGVGMRVDSVQPLPRQMMLGAVQNPTLIYDYGKWVGKQLKRMGIQVNYAPVVDVNNNPENPVINDRSFGENKFKVAEYGLQYMRGMQSEGILTCAKHFPGHGDVSVDSHLDLPEINKTRQQLDQLELYPFREMIKGGVDAVMVAHLAVPAIDTATHRATSISYNAVTKLLKEELDFKGLIYTDALEMKGVAKYFPGGLIAAEALVAGNDMLCLPHDIPETIAQTRLAIKKKRLSWADIELKVKKLLAVKYDAGLQNWQAINLNNLAADLNVESPIIRRKVAEEAITLIKNDNPSVFPLTPTIEKRIAYIALGISKDNTMAKRMRQDYNADIFAVDYKIDSVHAAEMLETLTKNYDAVVIGVHGMKRFPAGNFGISNITIQLVQQVQKNIPTTLLLFGNPYALKNFLDCTNSIVCYEDESIIQETAADILNGKLATKGKLPVTIATGFEAGKGIAITPKTVEKSMVLEENKPNWQVMDSIANDAIAQHATPGIVVLVAKEGKILYHKTFGHYTYDSTERVRFESIYDMASVTKICATTISVMKLYEQGKLDLQQTLGHYIPWVRGTDKADLLIHDILLHQARLKSFIPFNRETIDTSTGIPLPNYYAKKPSPAYAFRVADSMFMKTSWRDTMYQRMAKSKLEKPGQYIYSDNDFIFLGLIVESISGMPLNEYVRKTFYEPMGLVTSGFNPRNRFALSRIVPTEKELVFRKQLIRGDVHDPGAAMFGGVAGHAGLFSNAYDLSMILQMLLNHGTINGKKMLSDTTITKFTAYSSTISRRGLGFDKPEKDNATRKDPYPTLSASPETYGHTGFTGIGVWADPASKLIFIFFSNRVHPDGSNKLLKMNVRSAMQEAVYNITK
jgi:beta-glucosidase-like glycosyl hydrolase/CubicO group peptidase (beta-lactamase class C family)